MTNMTPFPRRPIWKTLSFRIRVKSTEFEVLADALAGELYRSATDTHGCTVDQPAMARVDGKLVDFRKEAARERKR